MPDDQAKEFVTLLCEELRISEPVETETPLLSSGIVDSFDIVVLIDVIEQVYGVRIEVHEIDAETFDTPKQILAMINKERDNGATAPR